jgi:hypothetical protein
MVRVIPLNMPNDLNDSMKYCEHVGENLQEMGRIGDKVT